MLPLVIILAFVASSAILLTGREPNEAEALSNSFMEDVKVLNMESGKHRWTLNAQKVLIPPGGEPSRLIAVSIDLPEHGVRVDSESGLFDIETRNLTLSGNIVARTEDYTINTDSIHIKTGSGDLSSPDKVVLEGQHFRIEGEGFEANSNKIISFKNNVHATFF